MKMGKMLARKLNISHLLIGLVICCCITNKIVAAADLDCYHCDGEDCDEPVLKSCSSATGSDQCYVRLDNKYDIIGMGCASTLGVETEINNLIKNKELYICSTSKCNGFDSLPNSNECTKCDSLTHVECATQPKLGGARKRCGIVPYTQCYERINITNGGTTERGCLIDLPNEEFFKCMNGQDKNCNICVGNGCNTEIIPVNRIKCHRCNSEEDSSCGTSPSTLSVCPEYTENESCLSIYESGITHRGCSKELGCSANSRDCQICTSSGCNIADMASRSKELYGIFQDLPLNCYTCSGDECKDGRQNLRKCQGNIYQDCLSVFDTDGTLVARGCEDSLETKYLEHCKANDNLCFNCKANGCNSLTEVPTTVDCLYCDATVNGACVNNLLALTNTRTCTEGCVTKLYESKTRSDVYELARTCFEDLEYDDREICNEENNCIKCTDDECNTNMLPAEGRLSCLHCDGDDCDDPIPQLCTSYSETDQCYIHFDAITNSAIGMGCKSSLPEDAVINDIVHYFICDGDDCNSYENLPEAHFCYACNSVDDLNCITSPSTAVRCQVNPHTDCYARVTYDGHTERGCTGSLNNTEFLTCHRGIPGEYCRICTESYCNANSYPSGRQYCHRCNSLDDPSCETAPKASSVCPLFDEDDYCVSKWVDGIIYRGCATELQCDTTSTSKTCVTCENRNCNTDILDVEFPIGNPGMFQDLPLNCYHCDGVEGCTGQLGNLKKCEENNYQTCTTIFGKTNGTVLGRGCSDKFEEICDYDNTTCYKCKSNGCNVATTVSQYVDCIFCDAQTNPNCFHDPTTIKSNRKCYESCVTTLYDRHSESNSSVRELVRTCLDDIELDEREACAAGEDENCKACSEDKCNTDIVGQHFSCYQCVGDECQNPVAKSCRAVSESDQCFVRYDETYTMVELGCKSNYDEDEVNELIKAKRLRLCEGENCNAIEVSPVAQTCTICSSVTDENCAKRPSLVGSTTTCAKLPYTQCYSRMMDNGHTERGCLSSIGGDDFYDCLMGSNTTKCLACDGNNCNNQVYPAGRRSCQQCDSNMNNNCKTNPQHASVCLLYSGDSDYCVSRYIDGITYRGCSTEFTCDGLDRKSCRQCTDSDNCNNVDLAYRNNGDPGRWQDIPLNCYECEGNACTNSSGLLRKCQNNNLQTCDTVFGTNDLVVRRGCSDDVATDYETYCDQNPSKCFDCKSNGCNTAIRLNQYIDCHSCDSAKNENCVFSPYRDETRKCQGHCAVALYPRSSAANPAYELERTCLDDMDLDEREACLAGENELCTACDSAFCNTQTIPENRQKCYKCNGIGCIYYQIETCPSYKPNDQCYLSFDDENSLVNMGCASEFEDNVIADLTKQKKYIFCDGESCNAPEAIPTPKTCTVCDSKTDERCATNPNLVTNAQSCRDIPYTGCYTRVKEDGHTARGCLSTLETETFYGCLTGNDTLCRTCNEDKCNSLDVFPSERWACHQCNSEVDPLCASAPNSNKTCPIYSETDSCVTSYNNGITVRGCSSSIKCESETDHSACRICDTPACNTINLDRLQSQGKPGRWQDVPITCETCEGEENCERVGVYRVCTGNAYQNCMTIFNTAGKVTQRGCSDAVEEANIDLCETNPENCLRCNSNGCNNATQLYDYIDCLYCDTDSNGNCVANAGDVRRTRKCNKYCLTALYTRFEEINPSYGLARTCFDDLDYDDREACAAGEKENCQVCDTPKCNTQTVPAMRLSCMAFTDDDYQDPQPTTCATYRPDDQCYIQFDEQGSVSGMGCRSEFTNADADYLLSQQRLFVCGGDNCNTFDSIPESQTCMICSSRTDINCAISPAELTASTRCSKAPYTQCYTRVLASGITERGCLSSLYDDEFVSCLNGDSKNCTACLGSNCNQDLFPENRLSCHVCDSATDPKCSYKPNSVSICPLFVENDSCVTAYIDDVTYRGCSSSIQCDATQEKSCAQCDGEACNIINLERKQDDNHGKWQDLPLTCLSCSGDACASANSVSLTCENNNEQDCMTVFENNRVVRRGCSDIVEMEYDEYCESDWNNCPNCKSNNCNNATSLSVYTSCVYCDTNKNQSCLWEPLSSTHKLRQCQGSCMTVLYPSDGGPDPVYELMRTCLNDKEAKDQVTCANGRDGKCASCVGDKCNTIDLPKDRRSCYQCLDDDCEEPELKTCPLYKANDKCFTAFDDTNTVVQMGCISSFRNQALETIVGTKRIQACDGNACNSLDSLPTAQKCAVCNSNEDFACATNAAEIGIFNICSQYPYTDCYTKVVSSDGSTIRGCLSDLPTSDFINCALGKDGNCSTCIGDGCNREVFPADRPQCYTCSSEDDDDCESNPKRLLPCPYIAETEKCRTAFGGNVTVRGCSSEVLCDINDKNTCRSCSGSACNSIDLANREQDDDDDYHGVWQDLPLRCHTCEGADCLWSLGPAYNCSDNVEQDCATVFTTNGEIKRRGCADDVEDYEQRYCRQNPHLCFKCKSNECNDAWNITEYIDCNYCTSETDESCALDPEHGKFTKRACKKECMVAMKDSHIIRSCLDDKEENVRYVCRADEGGNQCASCDKDNCNDFAYPKDRLSCHVCSDSLCRTTVTKYCPNYFKNDFCFAKYENDQIDFMGCGSSQNSNDLATWEAEKKLYKCQGNNCNSLQQVPSTGAKCLSCNSANMVACAQNPFGLAAASTESCPPLQNECVTYLDAAGHTIRGCLSKLSENEQSSCQASGNCAICTGDNCNSEIFPLNRLMCQICNSASDSSCSSNPNSLQICPIYKANDRCVTKRSEFIERGCQSELSCDSNDENSCQICEGNGCNTAELTDAAALISTASLLTTFILAMLAVLGHRFN